MKNGDTIESNNARDIEENHLLGDYYPEEEVDDTYKSSGTKCNYRYSESVVLKNQLLQDYTLQDSNIYRFLLSNKFQLICQS